MLGCSTCTLPSATISRQTVNFEHLLAKIVKRKDISRGGEAEVDYEDLLNAVKPPLEVQVLIDSCDVQMEIDTGASRSIMCESLFKSI